MIFCADGGGTKTDAILLDDNGQEVARSRAGPCNFWRDPAAAAAALLHCWRALGRDPRGVRACVATAGLSAAGSDAQVRAALPGFDALHVVSDGYAALAGAFGPAPGALIVVGTGVAGIARDGDGRVRSASGWGFPAGDRGGGAWLGFSLVQAWLERLDGYDRPDSVLWDVVAGRLGTARAEVLAWLRRAQAADFAEFAPAIVAARDAVGEALLAEAAGHLHHLAAALLPLPLRERVAVRGKQGTMFDVDARPTPPPGPLPQGEGEKVLALSGGLAHVMAPRLPGYEILLDVDPLLGCVRIVRGEVDGVDPTLP